MRPAGRFLVLIMTAAAAACVPSLPGGALDRGAGTGGATAPPPSPLILVQNTGRALNFAIDSRNVYWADGVTKTVMMAPLEGGPPVSLSTACSGPAFVAVGSESLYCSGPPDNQNLGSIMKVPLDGSPPKTLSSAPGTVQIALNREAVFWTATDHVMKVGLDGGAPMSLVSGQLDVGAIVVDATNVYWTTIADSALRKIAIAGGEPIEIARSAIGPGGIGSVAVDVTSVYWTDFKSIMRVGIEGGTPAPIFAIMPATTTSLIADGTGVYWTDQMGGVWAGAPTGDVRLLAAAGYQARGITTDANSVYWMATVEGAIFKAPK